ncbi:Nuclear-interacting partner of ALK [Rhynchospora pubera]|uniref:Nuclear-interacting partner of ALK n=1 Tax=Rhynchospora pubera TaxID=906938 RepID=A0AAV8DQJ2_9POAL|nr:Nuclear-interacting partner of ALK [Rhynchospora pubera]
MSDEPERRLKKAMDKLYHFPNPKASTSSSPASVESSRRAELSTRFGMEKRFRTPHVVSAVVSPAPPCRPWERGDLIRRLATFKAMTWFAKPKVISPVNCARRGWVNVELDTISCEACGARLMFSTPTSWTSQQVDKAAAVFSLKLDNGHKLLCPWTDNICEESLALFPPTPPSVLIRNYEDCIACLLQLSSLPKISSSALDYLKKQEPWIEKFMKVQSPPSVLLKGTIRITEGANGKDLEGLVDDSEEYYEALKLIGLCGWGLHQLPYAIDRVQPTSNNDATTISESAERESITVTLNSSTSNDDGKSNYHDPSSFVLECNLCGARAALWLFKTVEKPLRFFSFEENSSTCQQGDASSSSGNSSIGGGLSASIGGGPPATKQNYRPRVTLPVVSRHLKMILQSSSGLKRKRSNDEPSMEKDIEAAGSVTDQQNINGSSENFSGNHVLFDKLDEFDPIRQHRTFCPWICTDSSSHTLPGWKLTLSALRSQNENLSNGETTQEESLNLEKSSFLDEADDPVTSVRRLFMVSPAKRLKTAP